jgi:DNA-binding MarR family transcriptional regulator
MAMKDRRTPENGRDGRGDEWWRELGEFFEESVRVYLRLTALAARMHGKGPLSGPRRTVLIGLARSGPRTVAQLAREREQPRQRFQPLVNALMADGLLEAVPNPAHRQSPLIALTPKGQRTVRRIQRTEVEWRPRVNVPVSTARLKGTVAVMQLVRGELERLLHDSDSPAHRGRRRGFSGKRGA